MLLSLSPLAGTYDAPYADYIEADSTASRYQAAGFRLYYMPTLHLVFMMGPIGGFDIVALRVTDPALPFTFSAVDHSNTTCS